MGSDGGWCAAGQPVILLSEGDLFLGTLLFLGRAVFLEGGRSDEEGVLQGSLLYFGVKGVCTSELCGSLEGLCSSKVGGVTRGGVLCGSLLL